LLGLVHAPEVHAELGLSAVQVADLEQLFAENDSRWFASRILPPKQQGPILTELEGSIWEWFSKNTTPEQQQRLRQLEYFSQGGRMMLRTDVAEAIGLEPTEQTALAGLAKKAVAAERQLQAAKYGDASVPKLQAAVQAAAEAERAGLQEHVGQTQREKLTPLLGEKFDVTKLQRIYPMAPEFVEVADWINSSPLKLADLRGKVVLVHFYAFQCSNCHANFRIYQRWHQELADKGVVVVGIQTPETRSERDPAAVRAAANERELKFPILIDLASKNWEAWGNTMWPTVYVVDKQGYIRYWWQGELNWQGATSDKAIEEMVEVLLAEPQSRE
jgi:peroxiredoxin